MTGTCRLTSCTPSCHERAQAPALGTWHPLHVMSWALSDLSTQKVLWHTTPLSHGTGRQWVWAEPPLRATNWAS